MAPRLLLIIVVTVVVVSFLRIIDLPAGDLEQELVSIIAADARTAGASFNSPAPSPAENHHRIEDEILASTIRVVIQNWVVDGDERGYTIDQSVGHATVMNNSRLVTHNHFSLPLSIRQPDSETEAYGLVKLLDASGKQLFQAPLSDFELAWEDQETLVFAYEDENKFEELGLRPAEFYAWTSLPLQAGMEVAQIDWDETTTRVDWTTVKEVKLDGGLPILVLEDGVTLGASGGGIFWQGKHIANNWRSRQIFDGTGNVLESLTIVALDSAQVAGM